MRDGDLTGFDRMFELEMAPLRADQIPPVLLQSLDDPLRSQIPSHTRRLYIVLYVLSLLSGGNKGVITISLAIGFFFAGCIGFFKQIKLKSTIRKQSKTIDSLNEKIKSPVPQKPET